jgi:hypothetical protein
MSSTSSSSSEQGSSSTTSSTSSTSAPGSSSGNTVALYNMYIFDKVGRCLYYWENNRPYRSHLADSPDEEKRLVFGLIFSLKHFAAKLGPSTDQQSGGEDGEIEATTSASTAAAVGIKALRTNVFTLHQFESPTGYKFIANTSVCSSKQEKEVNSLLTRLYTDIFISFVLQNPLYRVGTPISFPRFQQEVEFLLLKKPKGATTTTT